MTERRKRKGSYSIPRAVGRSAAPQGDTRPQWRRVLDRLIYEFRDEFMFIVAASIATLVRAMGVQVQSGYAGLLYTCGHAKQVLDHGFRPLFPFLQQVQTIAIRARTMDLPSQRIVNGQGIVYHADANLVYHVHDVRKALIEIDELEKGMLQMLTLGVQDVLRATSLEDIGDTAALGHKLEEVLTSRLGDWGVTVDKAGFPSLTPSPQSLRITQLHEQVAERRARYQDFLDKGHGSARALALVGTRRMPRPVRKKRIEHEFARSWKRRFPYRITGR